MNISIGLARAITDQSITKIQMWQNKEMLLFWPNFWWFEHRIRFNELTLRKRLIDFINGYGGLVSSIDKGLFLEKEIVLEIPGYFLKDGDENNIVVFKCRNEIDGIIEAAEKMLYLIENNLY